MKGAVHLVVLDERVRCAPLSCTLSVTVCAKKHVAARRAWVRQLATRKPGRPFGERSRDRGEFGPCRSCAVGAENVRRVGR